MTKTFRKDTERCLKRGYDMELLKTAIRLLEADGKLPAEYRAHKLSGDYGGGIRITVLSLDDTHYGNKK